MKIYNPATNKLIKDISSDSQEDLALKYEALKKGQRAFAKTTVSQRLNKIQLFAQSLLQEKEKLAHTLTLETGKPIAEALGEIAAAVSKIEFFLQASEEVLKKKKVYSDGTTYEYISYDPLGVIANISAWNYPYLVGVNIFIPALICGNGVFYKPSEYATLTGLEIQRLLLKAGFSEDIFNIAIGEGAVGEALLKLPLDGYFFTGSYQTGRHIATTVAAKLVPVVLELGGKDPLYVTDEIENIEATAAAAVSGAFYNNGQSCCSVERIYVHEKVYDAFLAAFLKEVDQLNVGDPMASQTTNGAITREQHLNFLKDQVVDALAKGATVLRGGEIISTGGNFFAPTVVTEVNHSMSLMTEETFGPLIGIQKVKDDREGIELMNRCSFGLTASVYSSNNERGNIIMEQLNVGTTYLNCCDRVSGHVPWSGRKNSGLGTTLSAHGLYTFCNPKGLHIRTGFSGNEMIK